MSNPPHTGPKQYLLGDPTKMGVSTSADGQLIYQKHIMNPISILTLIISGILFAIYMWFYISPLIRDQGPTTVKREIIIDTEMNFHEDAEKKSLITWIHRSSLGRFIDITERFKKADESSNQQGDYHHLRPPLSKDSPSLSATLTPPPPTYAPRSDSFGPFELQRHHSAPMSLPSPPPTKSIPYAPSTHGSFDTNSTLPRPLLSPRSRPPSPLHINITGSEGRKEIRRLGWF